MSKQRVPTALAFTQRTPSPLLTAFREAVRAEAETAREADRVARALGFEHPDTKAAEQTYSGAARFTYTLARGFAASATLSDLNDVERLEALLELGEVCAYCSDHGPDGRLLDLTSTDVGDFTSAYLIKGMLALAQVVPAWHWDAPR